MGIVVVEEFFCSILNIPPAKERLDTCIAETEEGMIMISVLVILTITSSIGDGTDEDDHFKGSFQYPLPPFQVRVEA
jgi:hypothetical protein